MRRAHFILSLAAALIVSAPAAAQPYGWLIDVENPTLGPAGSGLPQSTQITVSAFFDSSVDFAFQGGRFDLQTTEPALSINWRDLALLGSFGSTTGTSAGALSTAGIAGIRALQPVTAIDPSNPVAVWTATYHASDFTPRTLPLSTLTPLFEDAFTVYATESGATRAITGPQEGAAAIAIIPAPSAAAALGLAGLSLAVRRRRA